MQHASELEGNRHQPDPTACSKQHHTLQLVLPLHISWPSKDLQCCMLLNRGSCSGLKLSERALRQPSVSWLTAGVQCSQHPAVLHACRAERQSGSLHPVQKGDDLQTTGSGAETH